MLGLPLFLSCLVFVGFSLDVSVGTCNSNDGTIHTTTTIFSNSTVEGVRIQYIDNTKVVFLRTISTDNKNGAIHRSTDGGKTWDLQSTAGIFPDYAGESIQNFYTTSSSSSTLYFLGTGSKLWVTKDAGHSYQVYKNSGLGSLSPNNLEPNLVLSRNYSGVYKSEDYGEHWAKIFDSPRRLARSYFTWNIFSNQPHKRIYAKVLPDVRHPDANLDYDSLIVYSDDFFKTFTTLNVKNVARWFMTAPDKIVVITCNDVIQCATKQMYISEDAGVNFFPASFPDYEHETRNETNIRPLEVSDDVIWAVVQRYCKGTYCYGDLYHSYAADREFTHSLSETKLVAERLYLDFTKYNNLDGIYITNQYFEVVEEDASNVRTLITFNKGSTWNVLKAPTKDANGQPTNCDIQDGCSLHLHGWLDSGSGFDGFYSPPNAIGVMVASGNIGNQLRDRKDEVNFYYSRNGGIDWQEVRSGRYVPEVGNHGTVVVAANIGDPTNILVYTLDEGDTWHECVVHKDLINVKNVRVSEGWDTTDFIMYGNKDKDTYFIHVDFADAYKGKCEEGDFEIWSPTDEHGDCFMGHKIEYTRRAVGHPCFLDEEHIHETKAKNCACTAWDYECAECYYRPTLSAPCHFICVNTTTPPPSPPSKTFCEKSTATQPLYYTLPEPQGYTLIPENTCDKKILGSHLPPPALVNCEQWKDLTRVPETPTPPEEPKDNTVGYTIMAIIFLALVVVGLIYLYKTDERFKAKVSATFGWKSEEHDASYQKIASTVLSSDEELSNEAPQITDQLESSETSS